MNRFGAMSRLGLLVMSALIASSATAADKDAKKLIEFGWDEPDTAFMRQHIAEMEKTPFDGTVFHVKGNAQWKAWGTEPIKQADVSAAVADLKATRFTRFTDNFLRLNTAPAKVDWFDDHSTILANVKLLAQAARDGGCKGILFDTEQYEGQLFDYPKQRDAKTKSWDQYAAQVRQRGREVMEAFQEGYPDLTIFLTFGYALPYQEASYDLKRRSAAHYGLLAPFLDGMVDAAKGKTRIIDGYEQSYGYKDVARIPKAYEQMSNGVRPFVGADFKRYREVFSFGFGVWMDYDWRKHVWDTTDFSKNYYTPEGFERTVATALKTADRYVWIYTETPKWWSEEGKTVKLPEAYDAALRRAAIEGNKP